MLADKSPVVRIMGAKCAVMRKVPGLGKAVDELGKDQTKVYVVPFGCSVMRWTVGEVVTELKKHPTFLQDEEEWQPNQRPERNAGATSSSTSTPLAGVAHP